MSGYPASFPACKLYKKTSQRGNTYFVGRWGGARVTLLLSDETAEDGGEIWNLMLSEAPAKREAQGRLPLSGSAKRDVAKPLDTDRPARRPAADAIPF